MIISKKTTIAFSVFLISSLIFMILLVQTTGINKLSLFQDLKEEELVWGKSILEQCQLSPEKYAEMKEILFNAEQEMLNKNPNGAAKYFNIIRPTLGTCDFELSGKPHPIDTFLGRASAIVGLISGSLALILVLRENYWKKQPK
jgi:hypothetical protein